jgi:hypothetical protein
MSGVFNSLVSGTKKLARTASAGALFPKMPKIPDQKVPTVDEAQQARQLSDRINRRKGVLATMFGGGTSSPNVGRTTLGGS